MLSLEKGIVMRTEKRGGRSPSWSSPRPYKISNSIFKIITCYKNFPLPLVVAGYGGGALGDHSLYTNQVCCCRPLLHTLEKCFPFFGREISPRPASVHTCTCYYRHLRAPCPPRTCDSWRSLQVSAPAHTVNVFEMCIQIFCNYIFYTSMSNDIVLIRKKGGKCKSKFIIIYVFVYGC